MMSAHPVDVGDLPSEVLFRCYADLLPLNQVTVQKHWRERYPFFVRRKSGLFIQVKQVDVWLDQRGKPLFSQALLDAKRKRNPGWIPAGDGKAGATALPLTVPSTATDSNSARETGEIGGAA